MPINKNAFLRYVTIDQCLKRKDGATYSEILAEINRVLLDKDQSQISLRTLKEDMIFLKSNQYFANINIVNSESGSGRQHKFYYEDRSNSIFNQFSDQDKIDIQTGLNILLNVEGLQNNDWLRTIEKSILQSKELKQNPYVYIEKNDFQEGGKYFEKLFMAVKNNQVCSIQYTSFDDEKSNFDIHPYFLKRYNTRWYLFGIENESKSIFQIPLDRIISIKVNKNIAYIKDIINWQKHFSEIIGISYFAENQPQKIILETNIKEWKYIKTKPLHSSQKLISNIGGKIKFSIIVRKNQELIKTILGFGLGLKVISPDEIKDEVKTIIKNILKNYD